MMLDGLVIKNSRKWEHTRIIIHTIMAVNRDTKKSFPTLNELMPLPTDPLIDEASEGYRMQKVLDDYKAKLKTT